jgi:multidrug efflux pump subunit AcrA (membrane-fusion protein)
VVTAVNAEPGQVVTAGQTVARIAREDEREVAISVPENRIGEVKRADELVVSLWANAAKVYRARVREVAPAVDPVTRTFAVRVSILDPDTSVQWGMTANVGVMTTTTARAAVVPLTSIYQKGGKPGGLALRPGNRPGEPRAGRGEPVSRGRRPGRVGRGEWRLDRDCRRAQAHRRPGGAAYDAGPGQPPSSARSGTAGARS